MATHKNYSPWLLGYSNRRVIAPGLFQYDKWGLSGWTQFWRSNSYEEIETMLQDYEKPLYIHVGNTGRENMGKFNSSCFESYVEGKIFKWKC